MKTNDRRRKLHVEPLEHRLMLSFVFGVAEDHTDHGGVGDAAIDDATAVEVGQLHTSDHHRPGHGGGPGGPGGPGGGTPTGPAIDLPTVAAHEFGHSLGLGHSNHADCGSANQPLMCPFYIGPSFQLHAEDVALIQTLYPESGANLPGTWDSTNITYSFTPDGARMDQGGRNALFKTMDKAFGSTAVWQQIYEDALELWATASRADGTNVELVFTEVSDNGAKFNASGAVQGDSRFGDIRIAAHSFDGASGTLAHAYFPPPNGATAAGDAHFDKAENWQDLRGNLNSASTGGGNGGESRSRDLTLLLHYNVHSDQPNRLTDFSLFAAAFTPQSNERFEREPSWSIRSSTQQLFVRQENVASAEELELLKKDTLPTVASIIEYEDVLDRDSSDQNGFDVDVGVEPWFAAGEELKASFNNHLGLQRFRPVNDKSEP